MRPFDANKGLRKLKNKQHLGLYIKYGTFAVSLLLFVATVIFLTRAIFTSRHDFELISAKVGEFSLNMDVYLAPNGGEVTPNIIHARKKQPIGLLPEPVKTGYVFTGWYYTDDFKSGTGVNSDTIVTREMTNLYAKYAKGIYELNIDLNGGTYSSPLSYQVEYQATQLLEEPTRVGYTFTGWEVVSGNETIVVNNEVVMGSENSTVRATWSINSYTLKLTKNNETEDEEFQVEYNAMIPITSPLKTGHTFTGWTNIEKLVGGRMPAEDVELIANYQVNEYKWLVNHSIMNGDGTDYIFVEAETGQGNYGTIFRGTLKNYTGFINPTQATGTIGLDKTPDEEGYAENNVLYYDYIRRKNNLSIAPNGGIYKGLSSPTIVNDVYYEQQITLDTATREGYDFTNWTIVGNGASIAGNTVTMGYDSAVVTANWSAKTYTLTYNVNGGDTLSDDHKSVTYDSTYGALPEPTRTGWTFKGWYSDTSFTNLINSETIVKTAKNHTIYAKWEINKYNVEIELVNFTSEVSNLEIVYGETSTVLIAPDEGYYLANMSCTNGYTAVATTGETAISNQTITIKNNNNADNSKCTFTGAIRQFTITYNPGEGSVSPTSETINYGSKLTYPTPIRKGYVFLGWYKTSNYQNGTGVGANDLIKSDIKNLYAKYTEGTYELSVDPNEGTYEGENPVQVTYKQTHTLGNIEREGHTFNGWEVTSGEDTSVVGSIITMGKEDSTVQAQWLRNSYKIIVKPNGGTYNNKTTDTTYTKIYESTQNIVDPIREGYTFTGWTKSSSKATWSGKNLKIGSEDCTLTANWVVNEYKWLVNHNKQSVDKSEYTLEEVETGTGDYGTTFKGTLKNYTGFTNPTQESKTIVVDKTPEEDGNATNNVLDYNYTRNSYIVTFDKQGGTGGSDSVEAVYEADMPEATRPSKTGYNFGGYYKNTGGSGTRYYGSAATMASRHVWDIAEDTIIYAKWTAKTFTVTYDTNGGEALDPATKTVTYNKTYGTGGDLPEPVREGHTFDGWYTASDGGSQITNTTTVKITANQTIYAHWTPINYTVTIAGSNVTKGASSISVAYNSNNTVKITPSTGYYLSAATCTEGYSHNATTGTSKTSAQTVTITNKNGDAGYAGDGTCTFTGSKSTYKVTISTTNFTASSTSVNVKYNASNTVTLTPSEGYYLASASCTTGYQLSNVTTGESAINEQTVTITNKNGSTGYVGAGTCTFTGAIRQFTITYHPGDGSVTPTSETINYGTTLSYPTPVFPGHVFNGWSKSSTCEEGQEVGSSDLIKSDIKNLYACYSDGEYILTIDPNGGTYTGDTSVSVVYNHEHTLGSITKEGHNFGGWEVTSGSQTTVTTTSPYKVTMGVEDSTVKAKWTKKNYTLTVKPNGGTYNNKTTDSTYTIAYQNTQTIEDPTWEGHTFTGWTKSSSKATWNGNVLKIGSENCTLTANWTTNDYKYLVNHNKGNIGNTSYTLEEVETGDGEYGTTFSGTLKNYTGFTNPTQATGTIGVDKTPSESGNATNNVLDYNYDRNKYKLTVKPNGGTYNSVTTDTEITNIYYTDTRTIANPTRTGYSFNSWALAGTNSSISGTTFTMGSENASLTANWGANTYTVTYNVCSGNALNPSTKSVKYDSTYGKDTSGNTASLASPTRTGYTFAGWYLGTSCSGGTRIYDSTTVSTASNHTIYAHWTARTYTVTLNNNGGSGGTTSVTATYGSAMPSATAPTRSGYIFKGYSTVQNSPGVGFSGTKYYNESMESSRNWDIANNTTLYAMWYPRSYTVTISTSNVTATKSSMSVMFNDYEYVDVTPASGYYLSSASCTTGYSVSNVSYGTSQTGTQKAKISSLGTYTGGGTCTFTAELLCPTCFGNYLLSLTNSNTVIHQDETSDKNMRFIGANPNNYVLFQTADSEKELFRVIGVFDSNSHGKTEKLVKLIQAVTPSITKQRIVFDSAGTNNFASSSSKLYMNDYVRSYYRFFNDYYDSPLVQEVTWKTGAITYSGTSNEIYNYRPPNFYNSERSNTISPATGYSTTVTTKIALPYLSDFLYSTSGSNSKTREQCLNYQLYTSSSNTYWGGGSDCTANSWLFNDIHLLPQYSGSLSRIDSMWALDATTYSKDSIFNPSYATNTAIAQNTAKSSSYAVVPSFYLKSNVRCTNCNDSSAGTADNPWILDYDYKYWNTTSSSYSTSTAPTSLYTKYSDLVSTSTSKAFVRTTYDNGSVVNHEPCLYYNNNMVCFHHDYWEMATGATSFTSSSSPQAKSALQNVMESTFVGENIQCTINSSSVECDIYQGNSVSSYVTVSPNGVQTRDSGSHYCLIDYAYNTYCR